MGDISLLPPLLYQVSPSNPYSLPSRSSSSPAVRFDLFPFDVFSFNAFPLDIFSFDVLLFDLFPFDAFKVGESGHSVHSDVWSLNTTVCILAGEWRVLPGRGKTFGSGIFRIYIEVADDSAYYHFIIVMPERAPCVGLLDDLEFQLQLVA